MSLALRLRALMRRRGIKSQNQLARLSGVPQSCIHRILTREERYSPTRSTLLRLAQALDTQVPWLTDGVASPVVPGATPAAPDAAAAENMTAGCCSEICALLHRQPETTQRKILKVVRLMLEDPGTSRATKAQRPLRRAGITRGMS
ncbi:helix-turn-helix transcriptional regulator [Achromobacter sp. DH1f]|uniref:helix-turn-helix domain-containing protein n=1 Tax=Achromobacter sp. DH1f TaxID=1397275 RepID=UPI000469C3C4|nr:helix-turn-helix transcriptional regulator [Achromobacter sp. DH1f]